jgi:hypothetical protein
MEPVNLSETSVHFYENTRRNIPEDSHFQLSYRWKQRISTAEENVHLHKPALTDYHLIKN